MDLARATYARRLYCSTTHSEDKKMAETSVRNGQYQMDLVHRIFSGGNTSIMYNGFGSTLFPTKRKEE
jgi:hypothetical protein